jgi:hypothetical protein
MTYDIVRVTYDIVGGKNPDVLASESSSLKPKPSLS